MVETQKPAEPAAQTLQTNEPADDGGVDADAVRNHPLFKKVTSSLEKKFESVAKKLADYESAEKAKLEQAELERAKAAGDFESWKQKQESEWAKKFADMQAESVRKDVMVKFVQSGVKDPIYLKGALAEYMEKPEAERLPVDEYIANLKTTSPGFFGAATQASLPAPASAGGVSMPSGGANWSAVQNDLTSQDANKRKAASDALTKYIMENDGKTPPGFQKK